MNRDKKIEVILNVYDLLDRWNNVLYPFGLGAFHSGVQIGSTGNYDICFLVLIGNYGQTINFSWSECVRKFN
jgi:hypothetical protein